MLSLTLIGLMDCKLSAALFFALDAGAEDVVLAADVGLDADFGVDCCCSGCFFRQLKSLDSFMFSYVPKNSYS